MLKIKIGNIYKYEECNEEEEEKEEEENEDEDEDEEEERRPIAIKKCAIKKCAKKKGQALSKMNFGNIGGKKIMNFGSNTTTSFGFGGGFGNNNNNNNNNSLNNIILTPNEHQQAKTNALIQFNIFLDNFLLIIKSFIKPPLFY